MRCMNRLWFRTSAKGRVLATQIVFHKNSQQGMWRMSFFHCVHYMCPPDKVRTANYLEMH